MQYRFSKRLRVYFTLIVSIIVLFTLGAVAAVLLALRYESSVGSLGLLTLASLILVSLVASGLLSVFVGRRILIPMVKLSEASKEIARGNFAVTVEDSSRLDEVQTTFHNFNAMVRALNGTTTLANDFVANVSHEFKTPLSAIEGYAMLLQDTELSEDERELYTDKILRSTHRLSTLVESILVLSKLENNPLPKKTTFRLDEQLRQAVVFLEPQWAKKSLRFDVQLDEVTVQGCESFLFHVWTNLLSNAIKFSDTEQEISLRLLEQTNCVVVSIIDHGCGMDEATCARIFEKFYQSDSSRRSEGNGLGLALVKRIVELSDGVIEVESAVGRGSTFRIILPKQEDLWNN